MLMKRKTTKLKRIFLLLFYFFTLSSTLFAQRATISGYLIDKASGERLIGANVYEPKTLKGVSTNNYGFYSISLPKGETTLLFSFVGSKTEEVKFNLVKDTIITINLELIKTIEEITVHGESAKRLTNTEMSVVELPVQQVQKIPLIMGEPDLLKVLQLLPGVKSGTEGTSGIYVRGGDPDQNLFLLDEVPVYNANHLFGFFSVFNPSAVKTVKLYKGGFPARFGGRLSSVIDINMKEGNIKKFEGEASIGLISSRISVEGPIFKDKTSFIISGRRTYVDALIQPFVKLSGNSDMSAGYYFYDLNAKINHIFSERSRLYLSGYFGEDKFYLKDKSDYTIDSISYRNSEQANLGWGNGTGALRWNYLISNKLFSNFIATYSNYIFDISYDYRDKNLTQNKEQRDYFKYSSGIEDLSAKAEFDYFPLPQHSVKFGTGYIYHTFNPGVNRLQMNSNDNSIQNYDTLIGNQKIYAQEIYGYIEDNFDLSPKLKFNLGCHFAGFSVQNTFYPSIEPRASLRYSVNENFSLKASYSRMSQNIHLLSSSTISLPTDLWLPTTKRIKPQKSNQYALGAFFKLPWDLETSVEGYYKSMTNLIEYKDGASYMIFAKGWEDQVELGKGWSYGTEILIEKKIGKTTGWIGYTLSWTQRQFDKLNFGKPYFARYDRRHDVSITITHEFSKKIDAGVTWVYSTGNAITLGTQKYKIDESLTNGYNYYNNNLTYYKSRNNYRMPPYNRLDLGVNFHKKLKIGERTFSISVYNAYNRLNPFYLYWGYKNSETGKPGGSSYQEDTEPALIQVSIFPIIPSFSYTLKF
jgi:hypothetical protein